MEPENNGALSDLRIIELGGGAAELAGRLMADMGADVILVEPPGGVRSRIDGPFQASHADLDHSLKFVANNGNKRSVVLDLASESDRGAVRALAAEADVLIESFTPSHLPSLGIGFEDLRALNPALVYASLSPFGQYGPYRDLAATELTVQSLAGVGWVYGDDEREPCLIPGDATERVGSMHLVLGILLALRSRRWSGRGQHVDVSRHDIGVWQLVSGSISRIGLRNEVYRRPGKTSTGVGSIYRCSDGIVQFFPSTPKQFRNMVTTWMNDKTFDDPVWDDQEFRRDNWDVVDAHVQAFLADSKVADVEQQVAEADFPMAPMNTMEEFASHPHTIARRFIEERDDPNLGRHRAPGAPYRFSATPWAIRRPAPGLDQHGDELRAAPPTAAEARAALSRSPHAGDRPRRPLEGVRILDLSRVFAGPFATMLLAFHGAEVVRVESEDLPAFRAPQQPNYAELNRNKLVCALDFSSPEGNGLLKRLAAQCDIVVENFRPTVIDRLGLGYEELRKVRPNLIMLSMSGYGRDGPLRDRSAFGQLLMAFSGLSYIWGHPESDLDTRPKNAYSDFVLGAQAAMAAMMALEHRDRTGAGQYIESAHVEGLAGILGPELLECLVNGRNPEPTGNASRAYAPHGVYRCRGWDSWVSIAIDGDEGWSRLRRAMDDPPWASDDRFATHADRVQNRRELDNAINAWTSTKLSQQVQGLLQSHGIAAGAVQNPLDVLHDEHLQARGSIVRVEQDPEWWGTLDHPGLSIHLSETPGWAGDSAPTPGRDNDYVYKQLLGLSAAEIDRLTTGGILR